MPTGNSSRAATLSLKGRVEFTCLNVVSHLQLNMGQSILSFESVLSWRRVSSEQQLDSQFVLISFREIRVFQTCA